MIKRILLCLSFVIVFSVAVFAEERGKVFEFPTTKNDAALHFTSFPDIFNWNIDYPQMGWEDAMDWFLAGMKVEGPDFSLNAGDVMDARWWSGPEQIRAKTGQYWTGFRKRFEDKGIRLYIAPGDHEYGDDQGLRRAANARVFGEQFERIFDMPMNGPDNHKGRAYCFREKNLAVITLDTFEDRGNHFAYTVGDEQLEWLEQTLKAYEDVEFIIVQGHLPVIGPVKSKNSSASMLKKGEDSRLWKMMVKYGVDVYLCGEHHRITCKKRDGVWQLVHGALWGTQTDVNYLRGSVWPGKLLLELYKFDLEYGGGYLGDHPHRSARNRPREKVAISEEAINNGPRLAGKLVLKSTLEGNKTTDATGVFAKHLSSEDQPGK